MWMHTLSFIALMVVLTAGGYGPEQQVAPQHAPASDWTTVIVAVCGMLGACVPAYFGYKRYKRK